MKETICGRTHGRHAFIKVLGITALALFMLVSIAGAAPYAYITNGTDNTASVIDTATNTVTATVNVGILPKALRQFIGPLPTPELIDPSDINITRITTSGSASDPRIYGDRIVWEDNRNEDSDLYIHGNSDVYMYDPPPTRKLR